MLKTFFLFKVLRPDIWKIGNTAATLFPLSINLHIIFSIKQLISGLENIRNSEKNIISHSLRWHFYSVGLIIFIQMNVKKQISSVYYNTW